MLFFLIYLSSHPFFILGLFKKCLVASTDEEEGDGDVLVMFEVQMFGGCDAYDT